MRVQLTEAALDEGRVDGAMRKPADERGYHTVSRARISACNPSKEAS